MLLSRNYAPSAAIAPFVRRHYVFQADLPDDFEMIDRLLSETAFIRVLIKGDWAAEVMPDDWQYFGPVCLSGANSRPMRVRVRGPFLVVGIAVRPGGWAALFREPARDLADRIVRLGDQWGTRSTELYDRLTNAADDMARVAIIEDVVAQRLFEIGTHKVCGISERFEAMARSDSTIRVADAADTLGLSVRRLERTCYASFGHSPKAILRRSRFLDMASAFRGFTDPSRDDLAALRYFDHSHRNREFRRFIGMTPGAFEKAQTPLLTAGLKLRADGVS
jgi:AraC-like DNA-binding protein